MQTGSQPIFFLTIQFFRIMKNWSIPFVCLLIGSLCCCNSDVPKPEGAARLLFGNDLTIGHVRNGNNFMAPLTGVNVALRHLSTADNAGYNGNPFDLTVENGDIIEFSKPGKDTVRILVDTLGDLGALGISMFDSSISAADSVNVSGTVTDCFGMPTDSLRVYVGSSFVLTNRYGQYAHKVRAAASLRIRFVGNRTGGTYGTITASASGQGANTIIDVAFDEDGSKKLSIE